MSDQTAPTNASATAPSDKPKAKRAAASTPTTLDGIARAMLRARNVKSDERLSDQKKVLRGMLRGKYWSACVKAAPKSYGPKGSIKREPNDRRPWGAIPATVAQAIVKDAKR